MRAPHFAVVVGSLANGFRIASIESDPLAAKKKVATELRVGDLAEVVEVLAPSSVNERYADDETGDHFIMMDSGFGEGITLFGPFDDSEDAEKFGENECGDQDWSAWDAPSALEPADRPRG